MNKKVLLVGLAIIGILGLIFNNSLQPALAAAPKGTITGTVILLRPIGDPPATKAGIKVFIEGTTLSDLTDVDGIYVINNVPVDTFFTVVAYNVDQSLTPGTGLSWLNVSGDDAVRFGVYIPSAGATLVLPTLTVNDDPIWVGAP